MPIVKSAIGMTRFGMTRFIGKLGNGATVLDLGCGSGRPVAQHMAELGLHVTGVDSSPSMISFCRERLPDKEWIVADMRQLALGRRFDGILAWDRFFHLNHDDQRRMFPIFADHAAAGALLMFNTGPPARPWVNTTATPSITQVSRQRNMKRSSGVSDSM